MRYLTFALGKGRLAKQTLELFEKIGITCEEMKDKDSRKLIFTNEELKLRFFLVITLVCFLWNAGNISCLSDRRYVQSVFVL